MKYFRALIIVPLLLACGSLFAANPSYKDFNTTYFTTNGGIIGIQPGLLGAATNGIQVLGGFGTNNNLRDTTLSGKPIATNLNANLRNSTNFPGPLSTAVNNGSNALVLNPAGVTEMGYDDAVETIWFKQPPTFDGGSVTNTSAGAIRAGGVSQSNLWEGAFLGNGAPLTNVFGIQVGDFGMNYVQQLWGQAISKGSIRILSIGDSEGGDVATGLSSYLERTFGFNGCGVTVQAPNDPYLMLPFENPIQVTNLNSSGFGYTNWWGIHNGLSNNGTIYLNRRNTATAFSSFPMNSNVLADTAVFAWVNRPSGGSFKLSISTNGLPFFDIATINTAAGGTPSLGFTQYAFFKTNVTWKMTGTGGGDGYAEVLLGGLYVTNGAGALLWNIAASGADWTPGYLGCNTNVLFPYLQKIHPDIILIESVHSAVPQYVINTLTNTVWNGTNFPTIVLMGCPPTAQNGPAYTYGISTANRQTAINNLTNAVNHVAFCDTWSWMSDTNISTANQFYPSGDGVHWSINGQSYKASLFLRAAGVGDSLLAPNRAISQIGIGNNFNAETGGPLGLFFPNQDGRLGSFSVEVGGVSSATFMGMSRVRDLPGSIGLLMYDTSRQTGLDPALGPFDSSTNFCLIARAAEGVALVAPGGQGNFGFSFGNLGDYVFGVPRNNGAVGTTPELLRMRADGHLFIGPFFWNNTNTDWGLGVLSVQKGIFIDPQGPAPIGMTNGQIRAYNGFSSRSNLFVLMPTNAPANGQVITATGTAGDTKWATPAAGGTGSTNMVDGTNIFTVITLGNQDIRTNLTVEGAVNVTGTGPNVFGSDSFVTNAAAASNPNVALGIDGTLKTWSNIVVGVSGAARLIGNLHGGTNLLVSSIVSPTNAAANNATIDFNDPESTTNIAGAFGWTAISNFNPTNYNVSIRHVVNRTGGNITPAFGAGWCYIGGSGVASNNVITDILIEAQIGVFTNYATAP